MRFQLRVICLECWQQGQSNAVCGNQASTGNHIAREHHENIWTNLEKFSSLVLDGILLLTPRFMLAVIFVYFRI